MENKCISCKEKIIAYKKVGLCMSCYQKEYRKKYAASPNKVGFSETSLKKYKDSREIEFIKNYFTHPNWVHHPGMFRLTGYSYQPDFYDGERNCFIEVAGSRQAYHANKEKYATFRSIFPKILLEIRTQDGVIIDEEGRIDWGNNIETAGV
jgi:hypothetical protein